MRLEVPACPPSLEALWLESLHEGLHVDLDGGFCMTAGAGSVSLAVFNPSWAAEIGCLRDIEAVIETGVVSVREDNDEVSLLLDDLLDLDSSPG